MENDPAQLRHLVYELVRMKLGREIADTTLAPARVRECIRALETAIGRVESDLSRSEFAGVSFPLLPGDPLRAETADPAPERAAAPPRLRLAESPEDRPARLALSDTEAARSNTVPTPLRPHARWPKPPEHAVLPSAAPATPRTERPQVEIVYPEREHPDVLRNRRRAWRWLMVWPLAQLAGAVALSVVLFLALTGRLHESPPPATSTVSEEPAATPPSGLPLPASYGVYAISGGQLTELEALPIKAPNPRIALSAEINVPSKALLSDGNVVFIAFRRELVNNAPEKASIRVIARVAHTMTFAAGKPTTTDVQGSWRMRSNSYEFNVAPLRESREMVSIKPETPGFALPAGRYALVLNGVAYDFTVDGPVTDRAQCLESVAAIDGLVYSECSKK